MTYTTKPIEEINVYEFKRQIKGKEIIISHHALFHLSNKQRKVFNKEELINMVSRETPRKVLLQQNGRYATYYRKRDRYRKLIIEIENKTIIVSFMDTLTIPKWQKNI